MVRKSTRRRFTSARKTEPPSPGPFDRFEPFTPRGMSWNEGEENPISAMLAAHGFPLGASYGELIARYGTTRHAAYDWEIVPIEPCPLPLEDRLSPLWTLVPYSGPAGHLPISFATEIWSGDDALANLRDAAGQMEKLLGPAPIGRQSNTLACQWNAGPATNVKLTVFPPELQYPLRNDAHDRDPRLKTACMVEIETGFPALSERERVWIDSFIEIAPAESRPCRTLAAFSQMTVGRHVLDVLRRPDAGCTHLFGKFGRSADGEMLIVCNSALALIPMSRVRRVRVMRLLPAKGPGGAGLALGFVPPGRRGRLQEMTVTESYEAHGLDALARRLGEEFGWAVELEEPRYDA